MISFQDKVCQVVRKIPKGKVLSYKKVAELAGSPRAWRAVGNVLRRSAEPCGELMAEPLSRSHKNRNPKVPCHRVIRSDGKIGGYNKGTNEKTSLLKKEGMIIKERRIVN